MTTLADYASDGADDEEAEESCLCERTALGCFEHFQRDGEPNAEGSA